MDPEVQARLEALELDAGETLLERRAWELYRQALDGCDLSAPRNLGDLARMAFRAADVFAAEAQRRAAK